MSVRPPYEPHVDGALPLRRRVTVAPWLGPREIEEAYPAAMLRIGGTYSAKTPTHVLEAVERAAAHPRYPGTTGLRELRVAIADRVGAELSCAIDPDRNVLITAGSMQALYLAATVCTDEGTDAIAHAPSFFYADLASMCGTHLRWVNADDSSPDWETFGDAISRNTSLAIVNTPCNPTGYVFTDHDLEGLARAVSDKRCWLVSDEAMMTYVYDGRVHRSPALLPELRARTLLVRSFSKMYSMGPWRVGYAVGPTPLISAMAKALQWMVIGVDSIAQAAALAALTGPDEWVRRIVQELGKTRLRTVDAVNATGLLAADVPQAGAVVWCRILRDDLTEESVSLELRQRYGIPAVRGRLFGARSGHLRVPFGGEPADVETLIERLHLLGRLEWNGFAQSERATLTSYLDHDDGGVARKRST